MAEIVVNVENLDHSDDEREATPVVGSSDEKAPDTTAIGTDETAIIAATVVASELISATVEPVKEDIVEVTEQVEEIVSWQTALLAAQQVFSTELAVLSDRIANLEISIQPISSETAETPTVEINPSDNASVEVTQEPQEEPVPVPRKWRWI